MITTARVEEVGGKSMLEIELDIGSCCGFGNCALVCPEVFAMEARTSRVKLVGSANDEETAAKVHRAADECPTHAIAVVDEEK